MKKLIFILLIASFLVSCQKEETLQLHTPTNLRIYEDMVSFDSVFNATSYVIEINGEEIEITDTFYPLVGYGTFNVRVKAKAEGYLDSTYTRISSFVWLDDYQDVSLNYSIHRTTDLFIYDFNEMTYMISLVSRDIFIDRQDYYLDDDKLYFTSDYLQSLSLGSYTYEIYVSKGKFNITITIIDTDLPYITSHNTVTYNNQDLTFLFELFGGSITSLSGNDISIADYTIIGEELVIKRAYINQYFISNPEETSLSIKYNLQLGNSFVFGYLFIEKEEG
ncbi:MAG TPA: hypothetical protein PLJ98_06765 [Acholeplasmataceae bacterium]|nr:hypothetical protein [Acholeplasmataceae bacterium]